MKQLGHVVWLFGLSGAGKSTLAAALHEAILPTAPEGVLMLDGDRLRSGLCRGLGFTDVDREENLRRAAEVARLGVESGLVVIAAFITPREQHRRLIQGIVGEGCLSLVYLAATLEVCRSRDPKGLYAGASAGSVPQMSGVDSIFDEPEGMHLRLDTGRHDVAECVSALVEFVGRRGIPRSSP
jgi:adenylyl-sulfate kinase